MTGDNVVMWNGVTRLDIPAGRVLRGATEADLSDVVVIGFDGDGDFYFSSSYAGGGDVLWLMELARKRLMDIADD